MSDVSLVATLVATLAGFVLGALWYGPLFGRPWMRAVGLSADRLRNINPARTYGTTLVLGLAASYMMGLYLGPNPGLAFALATGAAAGVFLVATALATNYLFEGRPAVLTIINGGYHAVRFTLIGLTFGLLG